jgi:hypothetical protein
MSVQAQVPLITGLTISPFGLQRGHGFAGLVVRQHFIDK